MASPFEWHGASPARRRHHISPAWRSHFPSPSAPSTRSLPNLLPRDSTLAFPSGTYSFIFGIVIGYNTFPQGESNCFGNLSSFLSFWAGLTSVAQTRWVSVQRASATCSSQAANSRQNAKYSSNNWPPRATQRGQWPLGTVWTARLTRSLTPITGQLLR